MSRYSELMGSFVRTGSYPLEANYVFPNEASLKAFYADPINAATLHKGLLKVVESDSDGLQVLYWVVEKEGTLQFEKLADTISSVGNSVKASYEDNHLVIEIDGVKVIDSDILGGSNYGAFQSAAYNSESATLDLTFENGDVIQVPFSSIISNKTGNAIRNNEGLYVSTAAATGLIGIPIVTNTMVEELDESLPADYITIPDSETDLLQTPTIGTVKADGSYVEILFSAIRKLQAEVARLKNSFEYGIYSYTDTNTAMSAQVAGITEDDSEPLWAIDEEDLSEIVEVTIGSGNGLAPASNVDASTASLLSISDIATWSDNGDIAASTDAKLFAFITTSNLNYVITLATAEGNKYQLDMSALTSGIETLDFYNVMVCISRAVTDNGKQYIYLSIGSATRDKIILEKYVTVDAKLQDSIADIGDDYYFSQIDFDTLKLTKLNFYSKYYDFSHEVLPSVPDAENLMYKTAHITIRSVKTYSVLDSIKQELPNNELIFVEDTKKLYIKSNNALVNIGASGGGSDTPDVSDTGMELNEIIDLLAQNGIIISEDGGNLTLNDLAEITFIHEETGKKFKFTIDADGNLISKEILDETQLLANRVAATSLKDVNFEATGDAIDWNVRGFASRLRQAEYLASHSTPLAETGDLKLRADRIKIGAVYAPLDTAEVHGCTRAFVELENTSDEDFMLDGCYLHFATYDSEMNQVVKHLPLSGLLKSGSTFVIAGKRYAQDTDTNAFIKVTSYDQEWYENGELVDFTMKADAVTSAEGKSTRTYAYGFALTYSYKDLTASVTLAVKNTLSGFSTSDFPYMFHPAFIDAVTFNTLSGVSWTPANAVVLNHNSMYKNTFELDPAKQAFQSSNKKDSSRSRWQNANTDYWIVELGEEYITFPQSSEKYPVSKFTPKASSENKNVCTDKTKLHTDKPNAIVCGFGVDAYVDRTFNWISAGVFDEYVFIRKKGDEAWDSIIESFNDSSDFKKENEWSRKTYDDQLVTAAYKRIIRRFPADNTLFTSHKVIVHKKERVDTPTTYEYVIGQKDKNNNPIYQSEVRTFTLYPSSYEPRIYQITDQQGFHWLEYQAWAAAANAMDVKIAADMAAENIFPVIINTGDVTQNGTRVNEWVDYFNAGDVLFSKYEQLNIVGNNDLCGTDPDVLGTGDDSGKSNGYFFHLFNCVDIDWDTFKPIVNGIYIPSLYYVDTDKYRFVLINTEITQVNCQYWFGLGHDDGDVTNIYTGFKIGSREYDDSFTSIYTMLYHMTDTTKTCIPACHEMPFTVVTQANMQNTIADMDRSGSGTAGTLVGSHCNRIHTNETGLTSISGIYNGIYWLSRLFEFRGIKLCIGGHKHTYACTYPLRELFYYDPVIEDGKLVSWNKNSKDNFPYTMGETLENDQIGWFDDQGRNTSKLPLTKRSSAGTPATSTVLYPYTQVSDLEGGVVYFMCQATGYKQTSNKELPGPAQKFSMVIPQTTVADSGSGSASADANQKYPMFGIIKLGDKIDVEIARVTNIMKSGSFTQTKYGTGKMGLEYLLFTESTTEGVADNNYGSWGSDEVQLISL